MINMSLRVLQIEQGAGWSGRVRNKQVGVREEQTSEKDTGIEQSPRNGNISVDNEV